MWLSVFFSLTFISIFLFKKNFLLLQDVEDGTGCTSSTSSDEEDETVEVVSESQEKHFAHIPAISKNSECPNNKTPKPNASKKPKIHDNVKSVNIPTTSVTQIQPQTVMPLPSQSQTAYFSKEAIVDTLASPSVPLLVPNTLETSVPTSMIPSSVSTSTHIQAVPLLVQTSAGLGYATTPDGMFIGMLQGSNMSQPQLVAIPMANVAATVGHNILKKTGNDKSS